MATPVQPQQLDPATLAAATAAARPAAVKSNPAAPEGDFAKDFSTGIDALAALTDQKPEDVRKAIIGDNDPAKMNAVAKGDALLKLRKYADDHSDALKAGLTQEHLLKLTPQQRGAIRDFYTNAGQPVQNYDAPPGTTESDDDKNKRQAAALANAANDGDKNMPPAMKFFMMLFMMIARAFGLEDFANSISKMMGDTPGGQGDGTFTGQAMAAGAARYGNEKEINDIVAGTQGQGTLQGVANLAVNLRGEHETGWNGGAMVRACMGSEGSAWCGGFVRFCFDKMGISGVYDQADYRGASSYAAHAAQYGAFHKVGSGYTPKVGDVVSMGSSVGSGHVGIVVKVEGDQLTYISGNDGDAVTPHTVSVGATQSGNHPILGYCDTHKIAEAKGIRLDGQQQQQAPAHKVQRA